MAKDPAFLFYPGDWLGGTLGMTFEQKGAYMELLMLQFNRGHMTEHMIRQTVGQHWDTLKEKFKQDGNGLWFNVRLEDEKEKRKNFVSSRKNNISGENQYTKGKKKTGHKTTQTTKHMSNHMEDEDVNEIDNKNNNKKEFDFSKPDIDGDEIVFPIDTTPVRELWMGWKRYRWIAHSARYGMMGEQADLKRLERMDFKQIESTILTAIASNWKNLYPEKNGTRTNTNGKGHSAKADQSRATDAYLAEYYSNKAKQQ